MSVRCAFYEREVNRPGYASHIELVSVFNPNFVVAFDAHGRRLRGGRYSGKCNHLTKCTDSEKPVPQYKTTPTSPQVEPQLTRAENKEAQPPRDPLIESTPPRRRQRQQGRKRNKKSKSKRKLNNIRRKSKRRKIRKNKKTRSGAGKSKSKPFDSRELRIPSESSRRRLYFQEKSNRRFNTSENHNHPIRHRRTKERSRHLSSKIR